jgi:CMP-N-acetylneuraminic acid synthetase
VKIKKNIKTIYAMIPARLGSQRLKKKNLALVNNKALIEYAIISAKKSKVFHKIYVNSESNIFKKFAEKYNINFFKRDSRFSKNNTTSDLVVKNFFDNFKDAEVLAWVNTTTPFQTHDEIKKIINWYLKSKADTLITTEKKFSHANFCGKPLNYKKNSKFARTQDLQPVETCTYSLMIWNRKVFLKNFSKYSSGILSGKVTFFPLSGLSTLMIKKREDLQLADFIMRNKKSRGNS